MGTTEIGTSWNIIREVLDLSKLYSGYFNPHTCEPDCPNRSPYCHNVETCEQYRKYREYNEMTRTNRRKYMERVGVTIESTANAMKRRRKKL